MTTRTEFGILFEALWQSLQALHVLASVIAHLPVLKINRKTQNVKLDLANQHKFF